MNKKYISDLIVSDKSIKKIIKLFKTDNNTGLQIEINDEHKNGLSNYFFVIATDKNVEHIIVPLFSTTKTITWHEDYLKIIENTLTSLNFICEDITSKILLTLHVFDSELDDVAFIQLCKLNEFIRTSYYGKNSFGKLNKYKWLNKLPDNIALSKEDIEKELNKEKLSDISYDKLFATAMIFAKENYDKFYNPTNRSKDRLILNIAQGRAIEQLHAGTLLNKYPIDNVFINDTDGDDSGIDIILKKDKQQVNIDIKSTKSAYVSITSNRDNTDFYAIYNANSKYKIPKFMGYLDKKDFWNGKERFYNGRYIQPITDIKEYLIVDDNELFLLNKKNKLNNFKESALF